MSTVPLRKRKKPTHHAHLVTETGNPYFVQRDLRHAVAVWLMDIQESRVLEPGIWVVYSEKTDNYSGIPLEYDYYATFEGVQGDYKKC